MPAIVKFIASVSQWCPQISSFEYRHGPQGFEWMGEFSPLIREDVDPYMTTVFILKVYAVRQKGLAWWNR